MLISSPGRAERAALASGEAGARSVRQARRLRELGPAPDPRVELLKQAAAGDEYAQWRCAELYE